VYGVCLLPWTRPQEVTRGEQHINRLGVNEAKSLRLLRQLSLSSPIQCVTHVRTSPCRKSFRMPHRKTRTRRPNEFLPTWRTRHGTWLSLRDDSPDMTSCRRRIRWEQIPPSRRGTICFLPLENGEPPQMSNFRLEFLPKNARVLGEDAREPSLPCY
jgi:hypothetical protein